MNNSSLEKHLKTIKLDIKMKQRNFDLRNKVLSTFRNPDERLKRTIKNLKKIRAKGAGFNVGKSTCYPCGRGYLGNTYIDICPSCETLLNSKFSHLYFI